MRILFLDQTGMLGGAEFALLDVAKPYRETCLVGLFSNGPFRELLEHHHISVKVLSQQPINITKDSSFLKGLGTLGQLIPLITRVTQLANQFDLILTNTQKALVIGAIASWLSRRPLVHYLHDILSTDHFSPANCKIAVTMANLFASLVIADSKATQAAFVGAGGRQEITKFIYYSFDPILYQVNELRREQLRNEFDLEHSFVVGHFSRLSPWKGQNVLIEALQYCPENVVAVFVGDALFGEEEYVEKLHEQVEELGLQKRVSFVGFQSNVSEWMVACDLIAHTSTAPEPFGRVIVEGMLCGRPVVAADAGGATEIVEHGHTGWLTPPGDALKLAAIINQCHNQPEQAIEIAKVGKSQATQRFNPLTINKEINLMLHQVLSGR
jgi:glycosyltransferase involved in cell wall biosynthesis